MNFLKLSSSLLFLGMISLSSMAQKITMIEGDLAPLKGETSIVVKFTYDHMGVGKFDKEEDYVARKRDDYNEKEPGRGDNWARDWARDRERLFEPKFIELFERETGMTVKNEAKYTLIFKTIFTEPGYYLPGVRHENARIDGEAWIVEAGSEKAIAKISVEKAPGRFSGPADDTGVWIAEAYAAAGKYLGKFIKKNDK